MVDKVEMRVLFTVHKKYVVDTLIFNMQTHYDITSSLWVGLNFKVKYAPYQPFVRILYCPKFLLLQEKLQVYSSAHQSYIIQGKMRLNYSLLDSSFSSRPCMRTANIDSMSSSISFASSSHDSKGATKIWSWISSS